MTQWKVKRRTPPRTASGPHAASQIHSLTPQGRDAVARLVRPRIGVWGPVGTIPDIFSSALKAAAL
ncbi:MAG: hypothetical protein HOP18_00680 [Deltaproteobacteria bacterium]|nr:hypothetical protein [Deltaproteobacteria bacterium]